MGMEKDSTGQQICVAECPENTYTDYSKGKC
jgi:hypothetical protein